MNTEKLNSCPVCKGQDIVHFLDCKDHSISKEVFTISECKNCTLKFTNPRPTENTIGKYYQSQEYISHSNTSKGLINKLYHMVRKITLGKKLNLINGLATKSTLLDVGCGTGYFLKTCKDNGWVVDGMEPDPSARELAQKITNLEIFKSIFDIEKQGTYEVVTMWHVLEHVHMLNETILKLNVLLKPNGKLIIAVPNPESWDAKHYGEFWAAYDVPRHLYHFTQESVNELLKNHGFKLVKTIPMKFDSYYVSMMSEKYKSPSNTINYFKSIINGCKSNIYGRFNKKNYSSIIYVAQKF